MEEIWKDIEGYEGLYQVSNLGRVRNKHNKILRYRISNCGYYRYALCKDGKYKYLSIHRLVAEAFIPNPDNLPCVNHKDENKKNNFVDNLEWCTSAYNNIYGTRRKRMAVKLYKPVFQYTLDGEFIKEWNSLKEINETLGFYYQSIGKVCKGLKGYKTAYGYVWRFKTN